MEPSTPLTVVPSFVPTLPHASLSGIQEWWADGSVFAVFDLLICWFLGRVNRRAGSPFTDERRGPWPSLSALAGGSVEQDPASLCSQRTGFRAWLLAQLHLNLRRIT